MRKFLLALGLILLFLGLISMSISQVTVKQEPRKEWVPIAESKSESEEPTYNMTVQGTLTKGDRYRVYFVWAPISGSFSIDRAVVINVTDLTTGSTKSFPIPLGSLESTPSYPEIIANSSGPYKANALAIFASLKSLALEKQEIQKRDPQYPYSAFLPIGGVIFACGSGILLLGRKTSKRRRRVRSRFRKRKK